MAYAWKSFGTSITLSTATQEPSYGWVQHPTRPHWRNYRRPIPGGTPFTTILAQKIDQAQADTQRRLGESLYEPAA